MCMPNASIANPAPIATTTLQEQTANAPQVLADNQTYSPQYNQLSLDNLSTMLTGTDAYSAGGMQSILNSMIPSLAGADAAANTAAQTATVNNASKLAPTLTGIANQSDPQAAGLLGNLASTANQQLSYGTQLTPSEQTQLTQSVRGGQAARGMGYGPSDVFNESLANTNLGQNLLNQRMTNAGSVAQQLQGFYPNALSQITGITSPAGTQADSTLALGASTATTPMLNYFNPESQYANTSLQTAQSGANTQANNQQQTFDTLVNSGGDGGALGGL